MPAAVPVWHQLARSCATTSRSATPSSSAAPRTTDSSGLGPRRFYERVTVEPAPSSVDKENGNVFGGFVVHLDGKSALTSARNLLQAQSRTLAIALAGEWDAQQDRLRPSSMPLTRLLAASLDVVQHDKQRFQDNILRFVHTDSFALRADYPRELVSRQNELLEPVEEHLKQLGIHYRIVRGALEATQEQKTVDAIRDIVKQLDHLQLAAMDSAASCGKSAAVAVAMWHGLDAGQATNAARSEEVWQAEIWGTVEGGHDLDHADVCVRMNAAELVFRCAGLHREPEPS
ncbi:ATP synthase mitochondrial F1 complex assembly factor 2 [Gracilariopsis chorda]|uniref:ATP synthase mitochondrial F1 complex assembly factor 2 n=1 Tax=Gracilariopsis chorda TaxID=448386 RepID=A0A2V3J1I7_9FLOR|nr:ATP synthase mitochondrial F1 complex assembly factor 2 [Gracilariopsis chorda]|eukprot:PXF48244.1 ATP synthase mitochondrial F1 complex assembly factor 2 [Gracilariopsis chorda]